MSTEAKVTQPIPAGPMNELTEQLYSAMYSNKNAQIDMDRAVFAVAQRALGKKADGLSVPILTVYEGMDKPHNPAKTVHIGSVYVRGKPYRLCASLMSAGAGIDRALQTVRQEDERSDERQGQGPEYYTMKNPRIQATTLLAHWLRDCWLDMVEYARTNAEFVPIWRELLTEQRREAKHAS